jgi:hypothetical protein
MLIYFSRKLSVSAGIGESKKSEVKLLIKKQQLRQIVTMSNVGYGRYGSLSLGVMFQITALFYAKSCLQRRFEI